MASEGRGRERNVDSLTPKSSVMFALVITIVIRRVFHLRKRPRLSARVVNGLPTFGRGSGQVPSRLLGQVSKSTQRCLSSAWGTLVSSSSPAGLKMSI